MYSGSATVEIGMEVPRKFKSAADHMAEQIKVLAMGACQLSSASEYMVEEENLVLEHRYPASTLPVAHTLSTCTRNTTHTYTHAHTIRLKL